MFRRKKPESDDDKGLAEAADDLAIPVKPGARLPLGMQQSLSRPAGTGPGPTSAPIMPPRAAVEPARPAPELPRRPADLPQAGAGELGIPSTSIPAFASPSAPVAKPAEPEMRKLIVGRDITLSGEITSCDRLTVEGRIEATLSNCKEMEISENGLFKGTATIDDAEIKGRFEGTLTVRKRLLIKASGKVMGNIRYGQLEIELGGHLSGDIQSEEAKLI